jgi:hypothetical protein
MDRQGREELTWDDLRYGDPVHVMCSKCKHKVGVTFTMHTEEEDTICRPYCRTCMATLNDKSIEEVCDANGDI